MKGYDKGKMERMDMMMPEMLSEMWTNISWLLGKRKGTPQNIIKMFWLYTGLAKLQTYSQQFQ